MKPQFNLYNQYFKLTFWLIIIFEILSFIGHIFSQVNQVVFWIIILATLVISLYRLKLGFWIICTELFIGSFGYLFFYDISDFRISIRLGIFLAVLFAWLMRTLFIKKKIVFLHTKLFWPFVLFIAILGWGIVNGILNGNPLSDIFFDFNAYLYFGLIFIAFEIINSWQRLNNLLQILFASVSAIALKTMFLLFYFAHQTDETLFRLVYTWIRDTRIGEIASVADNYYRIFFQGHIWSIFTLIIVILLLVLMKKSELFRKNYLIAWLILLLSSLNIIISFSRSFWLALGITILLLAGYFLFKEKLSLKRLLKLGLIMVLVIIIELGLITLLVNIKIPGMDSGNISAGTLIRERVTTTDEAALGSRFQLIKPLANKFLEKPIFGSGFGTEVSYQTLDPRTKDLNNGWYTSYSFEWGYLDIAVETGLLGIIIYLLFIWQVFKIGVQTLKQEMTRIQYIFITGLLFCLIALLITHATTPYLNHPLGIFLIIITAATFYTFKVNNNVSTFPRT